MARKIVTTLISDLSGKEADETVQFSLDGKHYRIDLTNDEKKKFTNFIETYIENAEKVSKREAAKKLTSPPSTSDRSEVARIREWANQNGYETSDRGRIAKHIKDAYYNAQG